MTSNVFSLRKDKRLIYYTINLFFYTRRKIWYDFNQIKFSLILIIAFFFILSKLAAGLFWTYTVNIFHYTSIYIYKTIGLYRRCIYMYHLTGSYKWVALVKLTSDKCWRVDKLSLAIDHISFPYWQVRIIEQ